MGGGQLGRMFVHAAQRMGYFTAVLDPDPASPAGLVEPRAHPRRLPRRGGARRSSPSLSAAITTEFENVPAAALDALARRRPVAPAAAMRWRSRRTAPQKKAHSRAAASPARRTR